MDESAPHGFLRRPEPRAIGHASRGAAIVAGRLRLDGAVVEGSPFAGTEADLPEAAAAELQGFGWLDDLAALGSPAAREVAQTAVLDWLARHPVVPEAPEGPAWRPEIVGRRLLRWVFHAGTLLPGLDRTASAPVFASMHAQLAVLARHAGAAPPGPARVEATAGLAIAALTLRGAEARAAPALAALADVAEATLAGDGLPSRNPEALLDCAALVAWTMDAAAVARATAPPGLRHALDRAVPVLRALRHADGGLPRAHGGGTGAPGRLDLVLPAGEPAAVAAGPAMGFARLAAGRSTLILDAAAPPPGLEGHASTLGLEFTAGRQPLVVACGSGRRLGGDWALAGRASEAHATLVLGGLSSSRLAADGSLAPMPGRVRLAQFSGAAEGDEPAHLEAAHDGWRASHGLEHRRTLWLSPDGLTLRGTDSLAAPDEAARARLAALPDRARLALALHFPLHPAVVAAEEPGGARLALPSGEVWRFRHDGGAALSLEPSAWLDPALPEPVAALRIVLRAGFPGGDALRIGWSLARS